MAEIINMAILFVAKVVDNMLGTAKTIFVQRNRSFLAAIMLILSNLIYYAAIKEVASSDGIASIVIVSVASGVGCLFAVAINNKLSKDRTYVHSIMSDNLEAMKEFRDFLAQHHITNIATDSYTLDWSKKTISIMAYAETKEQSKLIDQYIKNSESKFKRVIQKV